MKGRERSLKDSPRRKFIEWSTGGFVGCAIVGLLIALATGEASGWIVVTVVYLLMEIVGFLALFRSPPVRPGVIVKWGLLLVATLVFGLGIFFFFRPAFS